MLEVTRLEQERFAYAVTARFSGASRDFAGAERPAGWRAAEPADAVVEGNRGGFAETLTRPLPLRARHRAGATRRKGSACSITTLRNSYRSSRAWRLRPSCATPWGAFRSCRGGVAELERQIAEAETKRGELAQDQSRLRENLAAVLCDSDLARRYLDGLAASEDGPRRSPADSRRLGRSPRAHAPTSRVRPLAQGLGRPGIRAGHRYDARRRGRRVLGGRAAAAGRRSGDPCRRGTARTAAACAGQTAARAARAAVWSCSAVRVSHGSS